VISPSFYVIPNGKENFRSLFSGREESSTIDHIASGLFTLLKSLGKIPYVKVTNGEISEKIFKRLSQLYL